MAHDKTPEEGCRLLHHRTPEGFRHAAIGFGYTGFVFIIVGVIGNILQRAIGFTLGLEAMSWYLIAIAFFILYVGHFITYMQTKKEK